MELQGPGEHVDPRGGPSRLAFEWHLLYEIVRIFMGLPFGNQVLERWLLFEMAPLLGITQPIEGHTEHDWLETVDSGARDRLRNAIEYLALFMYVEKTVSRLPNYEWHIVPTPRGSRLVSQWVQAWVSDLEARTREPTGWARYRAALLAPSQVSSGAWIALAGIIVGVAGTLITIALKH